MDENYLLYRSALISVGALYEDYDGPLTVEMIEIAQRILEERKSKTTETGTG